MDEMNRDGGREEKGVAQIGAGEKHSNSGFEGSGDVDGERLLESLRGHQAELEMQNEELRRTHDSLRAAHVRYARLFQHAPVGLVVLDENGRIWQVNDRFEFLSGLTSGALTGKAFADCLEGQDADVFRFRFRVLFREGEGKTVQARMRSSQGKLRDVRLETVLASDEGLDEVAGRGRQLLVAVIDVTPARQAEELLRHTLEEYKAIFQTSMVGIMVLHNRIITRVNLRMAEMLGYAPEEMEGEGPQKLHLSHAHFVEFGEKYYWQLGQKDIVQMEYPLRHKDGHEVWCQFNGRAISPPDLSLGAVWVIDDITNRKRMEEELRKKSNAAHQAEIMAQLGYFERNWQTGEGYWSDGFCRLLGLEPGEARSHEGFLAFIHDDDREEVTRRLQDCLSRGESLEMEFRLIRRDGSVISVLGMGETEYDDQGEALVTRGMFRDITKSREEREKRKALEAQVQQAQKMESVGRLAGGVAHDFNNMLGAVLTRTELALDDLSSDVSVHEHLEEIKKVTLRSADLTRQLLAFARKQTIAPKVLNLNRVIEAMLNMLGRLVGEDICFTWKPGKNLWSVEMDPSQLDQILTNLCVNARDAIPETGELSIGTENVRLRGGEHDVLPAGDYVKLMVEDDGCGMDEETRKRVFEPFFTTKGLHEGTGLGLSTVYGIVDQNGGHIEVFSGVDQGTRFEILLPRSEAREVPSDRARPKMPKAKGETILLVEDDEAMMEPLKNALEFSGYSVLATSTPAEALDVSAGFERPIDLLLTDVVMPGMNGRQLADRLMAQRPDLKCLFMSGYTNDVLSTRGRLDSQLRFIQKPFSIRVLAHMIRELMEPRSDGG